jgi:NitT/TauT family transport system substrate-binding protein
MLLQTKKSFVFKSLIPLILTIAIIAFFCVGCNNNDKLTKVTIAQTSDFFLYAPVYVAIDKGFFKANGLDVTLTTTGGDEKSWAAVLSGDALFAISDPTFVAISDANGKGGKVIGNIVNGVPFWGVTFNNGISEFKSPSDLGKYSVATFPAPSTAFVLQQKMFQDAGIKPNIRQGSFGTLLTMLKAKQADIALELEPNVSQAQADGAKVLYSLANLYGNFAITGITTTPQVIKDKPLLVKGVVFALQQAINYIHNNPDSACNLLIKRFPEVKPNVAKLALKRVLAEGIIPQSLVTQTAAWGKAIALRKNAGDLKIVKPFDVYVDNQFADLALTHK